MVLFNSLAMHVGKGLEKLPETVENPPSLTQYNFTDDLEFIDMANPSEHVTVTNSPSSTLGLFGVRLAFAMLGREQPVKVCKTFYD